MAPKILSGKSTSWPAVLTFGHLHFHMGFVSLLYIFHFIDEKKTRQLVYETSQYYKNRRRGSFSRLSWAICSRVWIYVNASHFSALKMSHATKMLWDLVLDRNMYIIIFTDLDLMLSWWLGGQRMEDGVSFFLAGTRMNFMDFLKFLFRFLNNIIHLYLLGMPIWPGMKKGPCHLWRMCSLSRNGKGGKKHFHNWCHPQPISQGTTLLALGDYTW